MAINQYGAIYFLEGWLRTILPLCEMYTVEPAAVNVNFLCMAMALIEVG